MDVANGGCSDGDFVSSRTPYEKLRVMAKGGDGDDVKRQMASVALRMRFGCPGCGVLVAPDSKRKFGRYCSQACSKRERRFAEAVRGILEVPTGYLRSFKQAHPFEERYRGLACRLLEYGRLGGSISGPDGQRDCANWWADWNNRYRHSVVEIEIVPDGKDGYVGESPWLGTWAFCGGHDYNRYVMVEALAQYLGKAVPWHEVLDIERELGGKT